MSLSFMPRRTERWERDLREYRRLLTKQIICPRETAKERREFYHRLERINILYRRLY